MDSLQPLVWRFWPSSHEECQVFHLLINQVRIGMKYYLVRRSNFRQRTSSSLAITFKKKCGAQLQTKHWNYYVAKNPFVSMKCSGRASQSMVKIILPFACVSCRFACIGCRNYTNTSFMGLQSLNQRGWSMASVVASQLSKILFS